MKHLALISFLFTSLSALAAEDCYEVSLSANSWQKTPELLCVESNTKTNQYTLTLKSGLLSQQIIAAQFNLNLIARARSSCPDCNKDLFALANPSNSAFNALAIQFDGIIDRSSGKQSGTVSIGSTKFYYRSR